MKKATPEQIKEWKDKWGDVFQFTTEDGTATCYLRKPTRKELSYATKVSATNPLGFNDAIIANCWLEGDEIMRTDDEHYLGICAQLGELVTVKETEVKKL